MHHPFCRFCNSPADKIVTLDDFGTERLKKWALLNLGVEITFCPGFSTSICWACVTTFQFFAGMVKARAECAGDELLASQESWWDDIPSNKRFVNFESSLENSAQQSTPKNELQPSLPHVTVSQTVPVSEGVCPVIEAIHTPVDIKNCCVMLTALDNDFVTQSCRGLIKLGALSSKFPEGGSFFKCNKCNYITCERVHMKVHNAKTHPDLKQCPLCLKSFKPQFRLGQHLASKKCCPGKQIERPLYFCPKCPKTDEEYASLAQHFQLEHSGTPLSDWAQPCWRCNNVYFQKKQLMDHFRHVHQTIICRYCKKNFKNNVALMTHIASAHHKIKYPECFKWIPGSHLLCIICDAKFKTKAKVASHFLKYHLGLLSLVKNPDKVHKLAKEDEEEPTHEIEQTDAIKTTTGDQTLPLVERPSCPQCHKVFAKKSNLQEHMKVHTENSKIDDSFQDVMFDELVGDATMSDCSNSQENSAAGVNNPSKDASGRKINSRLDNDKPEKVRSKSSDSKQGADSNSERFSCKFCTTATYTRISSLSRHIKTSHRKIHRCQECKKGMLEGILCHQHKIEIETKASAKRQSRNTVIRETELGPHKVLEVTAKDFLIQDSQSSEESSTDQSRSSIRTFSFKVHMKCPGCALKVPDTVQFKVHVASCSKVEKSLKKKIKRMAHANLGDATIFRCKICSEFYPEKKLFMTHMTTRHPLSCRYKCQHCEFFSSNKDRFEAHMSKRHAGKKMNADILELNKTLQARKTQESSTFIKSLPKLNVPDGDPDEMPSKVQCPHCQQQFHTLAMLEDHAESQHPMDYRFVCRLCPERRKFMFQLSLSLHIQADHSMDPTPLIWFTEEVPNTPPGKPVKSTETSNVEHCYAYSPEKIHKSLTDEPTEKQLTEDVDSESDATTASCKDVSCPNSPREDLSKESSSEFCDLNFPDEDANQSHITSIPTKQDALCKICNTIFSSETDLAEHSTTCQSQIQLAETEPNLLFPPVSQLSCVFCRKSFNSQTIFENHLLEFHKLCMADNIGNLQKVSLNSEIAKKDVPDNVPLQQVVNQTVTLPLQAHSIPGLTSNCLQPPKFVLVPTYQYKEAPSTHIQMHTVSELVEVATFQRKINTSVLHIHPTKKTLRTKVKKKVPPTSAQSSAGLQKGVSVSNIIVYRCKYCPDIFTSQNAFLDHARNHTQV